MSSDTKMKKITLEKLEDSSSKVKSAKLKRVGIIGVALAVLGAAAYAAYGLLSGQTMASRFTVNGLYCPACTLTIKEVTEKMPGIVEADVSLASQSVTVKYREKRASVENIGEAIAHIGYTVKFDGTYKPNNQEDAGTVVASVNGKPLFNSDMNVPLAADPQQAKKAQTAESFYSNVGKELILQAADKAIVIAQPNEVDDEVKTIFETQSMSDEQFTKWIIETYGSLEKFRQIVAQRLGIQKLLEDSEIADIQDPDLKKTKTIDFLSELFKNADVKIFDNKIKEQIHAKAGHDDWKTFWPRMINADTELKTLLMGRNSNVATQASN